MKKLFKALCLVLFVVMLLVPQVFAIEATIGGIDSSGNARYSVDSGGDLYSASGSYKYETLDIGYVGATQCRIAGAGNDLVCVGLTAGADSIGSTEGYVVVNDAADFLRFSVDVPTAFYDGGTAGDLVLEFDLSETGAGVDGDYDVRIFEYGNTTPIITDTIDITDQTARAWTGLTTLSTGIGADADISADDQLIVEFTATADTDDVAVYGARLKYRVGLDVTQS